MKRTHIFFDDDNNIVECPTRPNPLGQPAVNHPAVLTSALDQGTATLKRRRTSFHRKVETPQTNLLNAGKCAYGLHCYTRVQYIKLYFLCSDRCIDNFTRKRKYPLTKANTIIKRGEETR